MMHEIVHGIFVHDFTKFHVGLLWVRLGTLVMLSFLSVMPTEDTKKDYVRLLPFRLNLELEHREEIISDDLQVGADPGTPERI